MIRRPRHPAVVLAKESALLRTATEIETLQALWMLSREGYELIVVSRSCVSATPLIEGPDRALQTTLAQMGIEIDGWYACHRWRRDGSPLSWLLPYAAAAHALNLRGSWVVSDDIEDIVAGRSAGCTTMLIEGVDADLDADECSPHFVVSDIEEAAQLIIACTRLSVIRSPRQ